MPPASPSALARLALPVAAAALGACTTVSTLTLGNPLPAQEAVARLRPGATTLRECVVALGPPEEWRTPIPADSARVFPVQELMATQERDVLDRRTYTWCRETRHALTVLVWPFYRNERRHTDHERVLVTFDAEGRVETVSSTREGGS